MKEARMLLGSVVDVLSILVIMAEYEEIANISAGIGRDIAKRD